MAETDHCLMCCQTMWTPLSANTDRPCISRAVSLNAAILCKLVSLLSVNIYRLRNSTLVNINKYIYNSKSIDTDVFSTSFENSAFVNPVSSRGSLLTSRRQTYTVVQHPAICTTCTWQQAWWRCCARVCPSFTVRKWEIFLWRCKLCVTRPACQWVRAVDCGRGRGKESEGDRWQEQTVRMASDWLNLTCKNASIVMV